MAQPMRKSLIALHCALVVFVSSCAPQNPDDRFVSLVQRVKPSIVLLSMKVPSEEKKHDSTDEFATGAVIASGAWGSDILSVAHAVDGAWGIHATISNKTKVPVTVIAVDKDLDISLLRTPRAGLASLTLGSSAKLASELGRDVGLLGYPVPDEFQDSDLGLETSLSTGRLSSVRKDALELTMPIVPGESGAPIFVIDSGELVGMAEARFDDEHSIGFALPIDDIKRFLHAHDAAHGF